MRSIEKQKDAQSDTHPDAWQRFEKAVDIGLQTKPMHKERAPKKTRSRKTGSGGKRGRSD